MSWRYITGNIPDVYCLFISVVFVRLLLLCLSKNFSDDTLIRQGWRGGVCNLYQLPIVLDLINKRHKMETVNGSIVGFIKVPVLTNCVGPVIWVNQPFKMFFS